VRPGPERWPNLFSPCALGTLVLPNRIVMPAMDPSLADAAGHVTQAMEDHYVARAAGGAGLIITGNVAVTPRGRLSPWMAMWADDAADAGWARLIERVHAVGGRIFPQLSHAGRQTVSQFAGGQPLSASDIPCPVMRDPPRAMTPEEIEETIEAFAAAARRAQRAGADGVEIHMAHGYLVCQFLSPYSNHRTDAWGLDTAGRTRFAVEIVRRIRARCGADFPVQCRLSADERVDGGITPPLAALHAEALVRAGATSLSISACNYESYRYNMPAYYLPEATYAELAGGVRRHLAAAGLSVPVVAVGRFRRPEVAEGVLTRGDADLIAMGRALIADPDLPLKLAAGDEAAVRPCVACNRCAESVTQGPVRCLVNPQAGRVAAAAEPADRPKDVLVVGGGPAGIVAAIEAATRGHRVRLVEAGDTIGGKVRASGAPPEKAAFSALADWLEHALSQASVRVELGRRLSPAEVLADPADAILIAVGAAPNPAPPIDGLGQSAPVMHPEAALADPTPRQHVLVIGGGPEGSEVADAFIHRRPRPEVTLVEKRPKVGLGLPSSVRALLAARLETSGVRVATGRTVAAVTAAGVALADRKGRAAETLPPADLVVLAVGVRPPAEWAEVHLDARVIVLGDAGEPATILEAMESGWRVGRSV
jgi:2,4-dienoyl-CoA reductase-like NADH-dependent reductase (Old Yellow Enzyme family)/thioredoxin reductase